MKDPEVSPPKDSEDSPPEDDDEEEKERRARFRQFEEYRAFQSQKKRFPRIVDVAFQDFFIDATYGTLVAATFAAVFRYGPGWLLYLHALSLLTIGVVGTAYPDEMKRKKIFFWYGACVAITWTIDVNFAVQLVCSINTDYCCGEKTLDEYRIAPSCARDGAYPRINVVGGVALLATVSFLVISGARRWIAYASAHSPSIVFLPIVVKILQLVMIRHWKNLLTLETFIIFLLSLFQFIVACFDASYAFFRELKPVDDDPFFKNYFNESTQHVLTISGFCGCYVSGTLQIFILDSDLTSPVFGRQRIIPIVNIAYTVIVGLVFLFRSLPSSDNKKNNRGDRPDWWLKAYEGFWFAYNFFSMILLFSAFVFVVLAIATVLQETALFATVVFSSISYIFALPMRLNAHVVDEKKLLTRLVPPVIIDVCFLSAAVGRAVAATTNGEARAFWFLFGGVLFALAHAIFIACVVRSFLQKKNSKTPSSLKQMKSRLFHDKNFKYV